MRNAARQTRQVIKKGNDALTQYLTALEAFYPAAKGATHISRWQDGRVIVNVPLPSDDLERMDLFDHMAEVATRLLLETDEYIIISG